MEISREEYEQLKRIKALVKNGLSWYDTRIRHILEDELEPKPPPRRSPTGAQLREIYRDTVCDGDRDFEAVQHHILIKLREDMRRHRHLDVLNLWIEENE